MASFDTQSSYLPVAQIGVNERATFITRTYAHVIGAILLFAGIEAYIFSDMERAASIALPMLQGSWLLVLGGFILVSWIATRVAHKAQSKAAQYMALVGLVAAEAIIFVPMLFLAMMKAPGIIESAAGVTLLGCAGLTAVAFITRKDFSFMRGMLVWGGMLALVAIVGAVIFGLELGTWFSVAMIGFAGAAVLYDTSNIIHHYPEDRYVAASLQLFASIAMVFWYVLRLFMSRD